METLPHEAQLALTSFLAALAIGGPVAVLGTDKAVSLAGLVARFVIRRRLLTSLLISLVGGAAGRGEAPRWPSRGRDMGGRGGGAGGTTRQRSSLAAAG